MIDLPRIPLGDWVKSLIDVVTTSAGGFFDGVRTVIAALYDAVAWLVTTPDMLVMVVILALIAGLARGWLFGVGSLVGFLLIGALDQWSNAMDTLALVLVAAILATVISVPLGVLAARSRVVSTVLRPVLDFLQTMPPFVYLIPALLLFRLGDVPGIVATVLFAVPPGVRLTELGIRSVDREVVEAGQAFGASPARVLRQIQLPLALPSIMAGINQVIMLSLSMVVIASMVGAGGLGKPVVASLGRIDVALGFEAGLCVVILAIYLDRLSASLGSGESAFAALFRRRPRAAGPAEPGATATARAAEELPAAEPAGDEPASEDRAPARA